MKIITLILALCLLAFGLTGCKRTEDNGPMPPDMAKSMLKLKGYMPDNESLFRAVKANDNMMIKAFADAGVNVNARNDKGETPLIVAIQSSDKKTAKALIEYADINLRDGKGNSPIHTALQKNKDDVLEMLLEKNADVNVPGRDGSIEDQSVLYLAVIRNQKDLVAKLLEKGANPNQADKQGAVPLAEACIGPGVDPEIIKMLLDKGANVNVREDNGASPLFYIASNNQITSEKRVAVAKMLIEAGADRKIKATNGKSIADAAKEMRNTDILELLK